MAELQSGQSPYLVEISNLSGIAFNWASQVLPSNSRMYYDSATPLGLLLTGLCVGLPAVVAIVIALFLKYLQPRGLTVLSVALLFNSVLQSIATPVVAMDAAGAFCSLEHCYRFVWVWLACIRWGVFLQLLVALEFIVARKRPRSAAGLRAAYSTLPVVLALGLVCLIFHDVMEARVALGSVAFALAFSVCVMHHSLARAMNDQEVAKVYYVMVISFLSLFFPTWVWECMILSEAIVIPSEYVYLLYSINLRLVTDALLCWLVLRAHSNEEPAPQAVHGLDNRGFSPSTNP